MRLDHPFRFPVLVRFRFRHLVFLYPFPYLWAYLDHHTQYRLRWQVVHHPTDHHLFLFPFLFPVLLVCCLLDQHHLSRFLFLHLLRRHRSHFRLRLQDILFRHRSHFPSPLTVRPMILAWVWV